MENLLTSVQIKDVDAYTIQHQPIAAIDLMEQAAVAFVGVFVKKFPNPHQSIYVICGQGNNGGDGLAIVRLLNQMGYTQLQLFLANFSEKSSTAYLQNLHRLPAAISVFQHLEDLQLSAHDVIIDALLGAGLNKPLTGAYEQLAGIINKSGADVVAVDVPTGFKSEGKLAANYNGVKANLAITFQRPKINFFFPERMQALDQFVVVPIGLDETYLQSVPTPWKLTSRAGIAKLLKPRLPFSHKGTYGHALIVAGNAQTMGAALLCATACLNAGAGLVSCCIPGSGLTALNVALPEALFLSRELFAEADFKKYQAIAIGPGLGTEGQQQQLLANLLDQKISVVLDADAINILAEEKQMLLKLPPQSILTPHVKEFDRLFGQHDSWWDRVATASQQAQKLQVVIVLKNQYTFICLPTGDIYINPTGNPAMAQGGMGDVLTGIITSFLAQGYHPFEAAILGVFIHGETGDRLAQNRAVVTASQLAVTVPEVLKKLD